jgi:hypothetical protein
MKANRMGRVVDGALGGEHEGDQEDRAELAHGARGQQVGPEARAQLTRVTQDRDESSDRGGGERRSGEQQRQDQPGQREQAAERVGQRQR